MKMLIIFKYIFRQLKKEVLNPVERVKNIAFIFTIVILLFCTLNLLDDGSRSENSLMTAEFHTSYNQTTPLQAKSQDNWKLILVNPWNTLPEDYDVTLAQISGGHAVDERCLEELQQMMDDCRAAGLSPYICSSYRTVDKQEQLYNQKINELTAQGYNQKEAEEEAGRHVAVPGTSEHSLGLALDIVDTYNQELDTSQEDTKVQQWLIENSWKYGFILRYPNGKSDITGIIYEPWHYRYVGKETAAEMNQLDVCLEEYLDLLGK